MGFDAVFVKEGHPIYFASMSFQSNKRHMF